MKRPLSSSLDSSVFEIDSLFNVFKESCDLDVQVLRNDEIEAFLGDARIRELKTW